MNTVTENLKKRITDAVDIPGFRKESTCGGRVCALKFGHIKLQGLSTISMMGTVSGGYSQDFLGIWIIGIIDAITAKSRGTLTIKGRKRNKKFPLTLTAAVKQVDIDALASIDKNSCSVTRTSSYLTVYETNITFSRTDYNVILETTPLIEEKIKNYIENYTSTFQTLLYDVMRTTPLPDGVKNQLQCYGTTTGTTAAATITTTTTGTTTTRATTGQTTSGQGWRSNDQEEE
ncbi:uncharacterized protein LOC135212472 isoform X2 [Macrobrachium nipponense]